MLTELSQQHIKERFSTFLLIITCFHSAKPLFPCQKVPFSNLILIMALSLLWFQLLQPLRRFFFWPKIYINTLLTLSLWKLITETNTQTKNTRFSLRPQEACLHYFSSTKALASFWLMEVSHLSSFSTLEGSILLPGVPSCDLGDLNGWAEPISPGLSDSCLFRSWAWKIRRIRVLFI